MALQGVQSAIRIGREYAATAQYEHAAWCLEAAKLQIEEYLRSREGMLVQRQWSGAVSQLSTEISLIKALAQQTLVFQNIQGKKIPKFGDEEIREGGVLVTNNNHDNNNGGANGISQINDENAVVTLGNGGSPNGNSHNNNNNHHSNNGISSFRLRKSPGGGGGGFGGTKLSYGIAPAPLRQPQPQPQQQQQQQQQQLPQQQQQQQQQQQRKKSRELGMCNNNNNVGSNANNNKVPANAKTDTKPKEERPKKRFEAPPGMGELAQMLEQEVLDTKTKVHWHDIAQLSEAKRVLEEAIVLPLLKPSFFRGIRRPWRGVLLFGPPGTGKTMLAKAVATECGTTFFNVNASTLTSKYRGESEKLVHLLFDMARFYAPSTIFFDEVDCLCSTRGNPNEHEASRRVKAQMLAEMDGAATGDDPTKIVMCLCATNTPWALDEAFRRRLEKRIYIPLPDLEVRKSLFQIKLNELRLGEDVSLDALARATQGYSGADITNICRDASFVTMRRLIRERGLSPNQIKLLSNEEIDVPLCWSDFEEVLRRIQPSVGSEDLAQYEQWMHAYGAL